MLMVKFRLESRVSVRYGHESSLFPSGRVWRETLNCLSYAAILPRNFSISARCRWCGTKLILTAHFCSLIVTALSIMRLMKVLMVNASTSVVLQIVQHAACGGIEEQAELICHEGLARHAVSADGLQILYPQFHFASSGIVTVNSLRLVGMI